MQWLNQIGDLLQHYHGATANQAPDTIDNDFDQLTQVAPQSAVSQGLAEAFRSNETPPFGSMLGQLFGQSNGAQRASILNTLISIAGPALLAQVLNQRGGNDGGLGGLLGSLTGSAQPTITPEQAERVPPEAVQDIAAEAEQRDPSIVDRVSDLYAQNPTLIKTLGGAALAVILAKLAKDHSGLNL